MLHHKPTPQDELLAREVFGQAVIVDDKDSSSAHSRAIIDGRPFAVSTVTPGEPFSDLHRKVKAAIIAPISYRKKVIAVLNVVSTTRPFFPKYTVKIIELITRQLELYRHLMETIAQLKHQQKIQTQTWEDFSHQIRGSINVAEHRAARALDDPAFAAANSWVLKELQAIRGLCRKASRVSNSLRLLADLANNRPIRTNTVPTEVGSLVKLLVEASQDTELITDPESKIKFNVHRDGFVLRPLTRIAVDPDLLEQAVRRCSTTPPR